MAECAVGVGLVHPLLHRTSKRNGNELQEGDTCANGEDCEGLFSPTIPVLKLLEFQAE